MMRPDELQKKMDAVEDLKRAVHNMLRAETIASARVCFNGHPAADLTPAEVAIIRQALFDHHEDLVAIKAGLLRSAGVDPTSLLKDASAIPSTIHSPPAFKAPQNSAESDPAVTLDCAGGETSSTREAAND